MSEFFFQIVKDAYNYQDKEQMESLYNVKLIDMRVWCEEQLDLAEIPKGFFRNAFITDMFAGDSDIPYKLWRYMQDMCSPESESEEEDDTIVSGIICRRCNNTLPPHTIDMHLDISDPIHNCPHSVTAQGS